MFDIGLGQLGSILASAIYFSTQKYEAAPAILVVGQDSWFSWPITVGKVRFLIFHLESSPNCP